jgi:DNA invertase Pin-like site-specific DNA recombinase
MEHTVNGPAPGDQTQPTRAAEYIRMSTEHQQYSTENQGDAIREYAARRGMVIVRTYADEGKSGLSIEGRDALQRLIDDVQKGNVDFQTIVVYDVSRWGRFQDADESAYYEYICKRAGIDVQYCAEQFENDGSPVSTIVKGVKRAMAGEYSRELSSKVFKGQCRLIQLGYRQGGVAGFGLRRMMVDQNKQPKTVLKMGEHKSLQTDRVVLIPGPDEERSVVQMIYEMFTKEGKMEGEIAAALNQKGVKTDFNRDWNRATVRQVLSNEKYIGNNVYNRISAKLKRKPVNNPPDLWIRADNAFAPIVDPEMFYTARGIILERNRRFTDEEMVERLKALLANHPTLSAALIDGTDGMPASSAYRSRFGSLIRAYRMAGFVPDRDYQYLEINQHLREYYPQLLQGVTQKLTELGATVTPARGSDLLLINGEYSVSIVLSRCQHTAAGTLHWLIRFDQEAAPDVTVMVRMNPANDQPTDYYLLPRLDIEAERLRLGEHNGAHIDTYRFESLDFFMGMAVQVRIEVAA